MNRPNEHGLSDPENASYVGRPFPLSQAKEHWARLASWGLTFGEYRPSLFLLPCLLACLLPSLLLLLCPVSPFLLPSAPSPISASR